MLDDRDLSARSLMLARYATLQAFAGIGQRMHIAGIAQGHGRHADLQQHLRKDLGDQRQPAVFLAQQPADGPRLSLRQVIAIAKTQQAAAGTALPHLQVQSGRHDIVAFAALRPPGWQVLGHQEQRQTAGIRADPAVRILDLGQNQVDDVVGQLMIATDHPHLVAIEPEAAVALAHRPGPHVGQRRTGLRFGDAEGATRLPPQQLTDIMLRQRRLGVLQQQAAAGTARQQVGIGRDAATVQQQRNGLLDEHRHLPATELLVMGHPEQARGVDPVPSRLELGGSPDTILVQAWLLLVQHAVDRRQRLAGQPRRLHQCRIEIRPATGRITRTLAEPLHVQPFIQQEGQIPVDQHRFFHAMSLTPKNETLVVFTADYFSCCTTLTMTITYSSPGNGKKA